MSTILRASEQNRGIQAVQFNLDDMAGQARRYLDKVREDAARIVLAAQQEAVTIRKTAEAEGLEAGKRMAEQMVTQQLAKHLATLTPALREAVQQLQFAKQAWLAHWEKAGVRVAAAIAGRVVRRELSRQPEITIGLVREALELAAGNSVIRIHLHPADCASLQPQVQMLIQEIAGLAAAEVVADPQVAAGGCRVETRFGTIDQQFESQLARIEEELT